MPGFKDRIGDQYGRLTVISHAGKDHRNKHLWLCKCTCGNTKIVVADNLSSKKSKSCGCLKQEFLAKKGNQFGLYLDREVAMLKVQYSHIRKRNHKKGFKDIISFDEFVRLSKSPCKYCGISHSREIEDRLCESKNKQKLSDEVLLINGIDRVDPDYGYTFDNVAPCCSKCNFAKHSMQEIEFFEWVQKVYEHIFNTTTTTTGVAAKNLNRDFIGIEMDEGYFKIAQERIEKA